MKLEDELRRRIIAADARFPSFTPDVPGVRQRASRLRRRRALGTVGIVAVLALAVGLPLASLLPLGEGTRTISGTGLDAGGTRTTWTPTGIEVTYASSWTLLISSELDDGPATFQLSNFDPGVMGSDPSAAWLCPSTRALPADGIVVVVRSAPRGSVETPVPPRLDELSTRADGPCGAGRYGSWTPDGSSFDVFATAGSEVAVADREDAAAALRSMSLRGEIEAPTFWGSPSGQEENPGAVIASGEAFGEIWNLVTFVGEVRGRPSGCVEYADESGGGAGCKIDDRGSLTSSDPVFGTDDFGWSAGGLCGSGRLHLDGLVADHVDRIVLRLDDGRSVPIVIVEPPDSWIWPYRPWIGFVTDPPIGDAMPGDLEMFRAGTFILADASNQEVGRVPFAVRPSC